MKNAHRVIGIVRHGQYFLLVQEAKPHVRGLWSIPGGKVDPKEDRNLAVIREVKEETGLDISVKQKLPLSFGKRTIYSCNILGGEIQYDPNEIIQVGWFTLSEIFEMKDKLRGNYTFRVFKWIDDYIKKHAIVLS